MRRRSGIFLLILALFVVGCGAKMEAPSQAPAPALDTDSSAGTSRTPGNLPGESFSYAENEARALDVGETLPKMIVYNADLSLVVQDTVAAQEKIAEMADELGGYVSNASSNASGNGLMRISLTLRVPAENFNAAMALLRAMALEITRETIGSEDVTQEYVDLESRLKALEAKAARLEELMEQAEDTESVLAVYEQLSVTQQEIEQTKGRMRYLERSAAMATIDVQLTPDELSRPIEIAGWRPQGTLKRAFEALINTFQVLIDALIWIIILVLPVVAFIGFVLFLFVRGLGLIFGRRRRKSEATKLPEPPAAGKA